MTPLPWLVRDFLLRQAIGGLLGNSWLGKTPLLYQLGLCVAAGIPFLGRKVRKGRVLYFDYENGTDPAKELIRQLTDHLRLSAPPQDFLLHNVNAASLHWGTKGNRAADIIRSFGPDLVILDPLSAYYPELEKTNSNASRAMQVLRDINREFGTAVFYSHHLVKPDLRTRNKPEPLEVADLRKWFAQARGASAIVNGSDLRIGVDTPSRGVSAGAGSRDQIALVMRGFARLTGELPISYIRRVHDEDGEPLGYEPCTGPQLLFHSEQQETFAELPATFRFKKAQQAYGKGPQATSDFLKKCIALNILKKAGNQYEKISSEEA